MLWAEICKRKYNLRGLYRYLRWRKKLRKYYAWLDVYDRCRRRLGALERQYRYRIWVYEKTGIWVCHWVDYELWKKNTGGKVRR